MMVSMSHFKDANEFRSAFDGWNCLVYDGRGNITSKPVHLISDEEFAKRRIDCVSCTDGENGEKILYATDEIEVQA